MSDDPPAHQVVGEELEQERGFVGVEVGGGGLADAEGVLEFCNERLDAGAVVVEAGEVVDVAEPIAGDVDVDRVVAVVPQSVCDARAAFSTWRADSRTLPMWTDAARETYFYGAGGTAIGPTSRARATASRRARVALQNLGASSSARSTGHHGNTRQTSRK